MKRLFQHIPVILLGIALLALPSGVLADVYKYVDEDGGTHYVTEVEAVPEKYRSQVATPHELPRINKLKSIANPQPVRRASSAARGSGNVEIFVTSWCGYCEKLEKFLKSERIPYKRYDIERNRAGKRKYDKLGVQGVPIVRIGSTIIPGYNEGAILAALR